MVKLFTFFTLLFIALWALSPVVAQPPFLMYGNNSGTVRPIAVGSTGKVLTTPDADAAINIDQIGGASVMTGSGTAAGSLRVELANNGTGLLSAVQSGTWTVQPGNTPNTTAWIFTNNPLTTAASALTATGKATVTTSVNFKASAGNVFGISLVSGATAGCWLEIIDNAGAGTLGTGVIANIVLPNAGTVNFQPGDFPIVNATAGIAAGAASAIGGASACATAINITLFYK